MKRLPSSVLFLAGAFVVGPLVASPGYGQALDESKQLTAAFTLDSSPHAQYAQNLEEATFYTQLDVVNLRQNLGGEKCVDASFFTWVRKFFKNDAKSISLVASITMPDNTTQKIPLFQISMDEHAKQCLTSILTSEAITPVFVARRGNTFILAAQAKTQQVVTLNPAGTTVAAATDLLSMTGGSAWLLKNVAATQTTVASAVSKIDASLSNNWSSTNQVDYQFELNPWPADNNWASHRDEAKFAVGSLVSKASGVNVDGTLLPTLTIGLRYTTSLFGGGPGHYVPEEQVLSTRLASSKADSFDNILKLGIGGFTTDQALSIADARAMTRFCNSMRSNFANYLTTDDALVARHAVLLDATSFYQSAVLRSAPRCESEDEVSRLKTLSSAFVFPANLQREAAVNRSSFVKARGRLIATAFVAGTSDRIQSIIANSSTFALLISAEVKSVFPNLGDGQTSGGTIGEAAITQLAGAGGFRVGCWAALPTQNLLNMVGMALNKKTGNSAAILVEFDSNFPGAGADPSKDTAKVTKISFLPVSITQALGSLPNWPDESCPLS
jgi:hypothetical protein